MKTNQRSSLPSRTWALLAIIGMLSRASILAFTIATELVAVSAVPDWESRASAGDLVALALALGLGGGVSLALLALLVSVVAFLVWLHQATQRAHSYGFPQPNATPRGAIACWFIPFVNLIRPYTVVQSLYQVSRAHALEARDDWVGRWPKLLPIWWAAWILGTLLTNVSFKLWTGGHVTAAAAWLGAVAAPLVLIAALCAAAIVWSIQVNQEATASADLQSDGVASK
ncbi:MAG TPA: DUF4328 domain-containing protein [Polyangiaceae bacterium]|jgi:hypothetical protein